MKNFLGWPLIVFAAVLWGSDFVLRTPLTDAGIAPALIVLGEHLILVSIFTPILWREARTWRGLEARHWWTLLFIGWGGSAIATWVYTQAFVFGSPLLAVLLQKTQPLFALVLASLLLKERRSPIFWILFCLAAAGAYLLSFGLLPPAVAFQSVNSRAVACALIASALWGAATVAGRSVTDRLPPQIIAGWRFALALPLLAVIVAVTPHAEASLRHATPHLFLDWLLIALLPGVAGMVLYYQGLKNTTASLATIAELAYPATALIFSLITRQAHLDFAQWTGLVLLLVSLQAIEWSHSIRAKSNALASLVPEAP